MSTVYAHRCEICNDTFTFRLSLRQQREEERRQIQGFILMHAKLNHRNN